jgi:parallel beta-helix repeat protein
MPTYYLDPNAGGGDDGSDWANAWSTLQRSIDGTGGAQPAAGDTVLCRNSGAGAGEVLGASVNVNGNEGNTTNGHIKYIGANASGTVDGTRYELDGNTAAASCLVFITEFIWFENFEMHSATSHGVDQADSGSDTCTFYNCSVHNNVGAGFYNDSGATDCAYLRCLVYTNGTSGIREPHGCTMVGNVIYNNGEEGIEGVHTDNGNAIKNVIFDNGDGESNMNYDKHWVVMNNVFDGTGQSNGTGLESNGSGESLVI